MTWKEAEEGQRRRRTKGAPDYDRAEYWDAKYANEGTAAHAHVEWLGSGAVMAAKLFAHLHACCSQRTVLHIGPGTSGLVERIEGEYGRRAWPIDCIVNVDFSIEAVCRGQVQNTGSQWVQADLRDWTSVQTSLLPLVERHGPFDAIVDKSTSDSISTSGPCPSSCHLIDELEQQQGREMDPVDVLACHLAALTRPGARWFVQSYSSTRFDQEGGKAGSGTTRPPPHWTVLERQPIEAPHEGPGAPPVYHWLYTLERC
ncbi:hypothetical protein FA10DRAFT_265471 [Acaromyces ingoldii]|uniref:Methyltransferase domain-containing protein n=1 Tax=Acaromyces ingoldii TaxID=215250 RepID=A0A316YS29_9BASI|nr:hypothetical protein FA10DRAFT_265471 [Acaromyces ingoldii]PWN91624.1 hypothetical protein FA10DRAFT_265471 [Acaromyces ingoldii]